MFEQAVRQIPEIPVMASLPVYVRSIGKKDFQNTEENRLPPFSTKFSVFSRKIHLFGEL